MLDTRYKIVMKPFEVQYTSDGFAILVEKPNFPNSDIDTVIEHNG